MYIKTTPYERRFYILPKLTVVEVEVLSEVAD